GLLQIISEPRARTYGAEVELSAKASSRLTLSASAGLLFTRITKGVALNDPFLNKEFAGAPHFTGTVAIDWQPVHHLSLSAQAHYNGGYWGDDNNDPLFRTSGWMMVDGRASWEAGRFTLFFYAHNLFDRMQ